MDDQVKSGTINRYRNRQQLLQTKADRKGKNNNNLFIKADVRSTILIPPTPNGDLTNLVKEQLATKRVNGGTTKVLQATGVPITSGLRRENPYKLQGCPYKDQCAATPDTDCATTNITYRLKCTMCEDRGDTGNRHQYIGCSGKSLHARTSEHMTHMNAKDMSNGMAKHMAIHHPAEPDTKITAEVITRHSNCLVRMIDKAYRI